MDFYQINGDKQMKAIFTKLLRKAIRRIESSTGHCSGDGEKGGGSGHCSDIL